jgi:glycine cleavage system H lipoate-binding protein/ABC-type phosphate transport system substrate-binding protein
MKNLMVLISWMTFFVVFSTNINASSSLYNETIKDSICVWTSPEMYDIASTWGSAYERNNPETKIKVSSMPANRVASMVAESGNIGLTTKNYISNKDYKKLWKMPVGRDIIVPVMNSQNPFLESILKAGVSQVEFASLFANKGKQTWGHLLNNDQPNPVNLYCYSKESNKPYLIDFLQTDINLIATKEISEIDEMLSKIQNDKYSLGFCRLVDVIDVNNQELKEGISLIPIDINENNKVDFFENIYKNPNTLERGVWIGKYPKGLFSNLYVIAGNQPTKSNEQAFLEWIITDGQQYLLNNGYSELIPSERQGKVQGLYANPSTLNEVQQPTRSKATFFVIAFAIMGAFIAFVLFMLAKKDNPDLEVENISKSKVFSESTVLAPGGLFFDKSHTWAFMEMDGNVKVGIADFLQRITGQITSVKMKNPGDYIKKGDPFLTLIQHGKQLSINSPISGKIKEVNDKLNTNSTAINASPYSEGWVYLIESPSWLKEIKTYFMGETYKIWLNSEFARLKNFFSSFLKQEVTNQFQQVIQDGGELNDGVMESFGPVIWEEFQIRFMNREK